MLRCSCTTTTNTTTTTTTTLLLWWYQGSSTNCASPPSSLHNLMSYLLTYTLSLIYYNYLSCSDHSGAKLTNTKIQPGKKKHKALFIICPTWVMMREKRREEKLSLFVRSGLCQYSKDSRLGWGGRGAF